jgi:hypothetical protein
MSITLDGTTGIVAPAIDVATPITVSDGGTGASTLTSNNVLLGAGTSAVTFVAPGSSGNVLTSDGSTWTSAAAGGGQFKTQLFTSPGTWSKPASATEVRVTVIGGGGGAPIFNAAGGPGGTSSFGPAVSATGGANTPGGPGTIGAPGVGTVAVGTALKLTITHMQPAPAGAEVVSFGAIIGRSKQNIDTTNYPTGLDYSTSLSVAAGAGGGGGSLGIAGSGGVAIATVPVSGPVTVTVGAGGFKNTPNAQFAGVGGAVLVEFVG